MSFGVCCSGDSWLILLLQKVDGCKYLHHYVRSHEHILCCESFFDRLILVNDIVITCIEFQSRCNIGFQWFYCQLMNWRVTALCCAAPGNRSLFHRRMAYKVHQNLALVSSCLHGVSKKPCRRSSDKNSFAQFFETQCSFVHVGSCLFCNCCLGLCVAVRISLLVPAEWCAGRTEFLHQSSDWLGWFCSKWLIVCLARR